MEHENNDRRESQKSYNNYTSSLSSSGGDSTAFSDSLAISP